MQKAIICLQTGHFAQKAYLKMVGITASAQCECCEGDQAPYHITQVCPRSLSQFLIQLWDVSTKLHEALLGHWEHRLLSQTRFTDTSKHRTPGIANICPQSMMFLISWFGLPCDADVTSLCREPNWPYIRQHAIFILPCCYSVSRVNVKYISQCLLGTQLITGSHQSKIQKLTMLNWQDARCR